MPNGHPCGRRRRVFDLGRLWRGPLLVNSVCVFVYAVELRGRVPIVFASGRFDPCSGGVMSWTHDALRPLAEGEKVHRAATHCLLDCAYGAALGVVTALLFFWLRRRARQLIDNVVVCCERRAPRDNRANVSLASRRYAPRVAHARLLRLRPTTASSSENRECPFNSVC